MTDHIVSFSIGIDDQAIINSVQRSAEKQIINDIKRNVISQIFVGRYGYGRKTPITEDIYGNVILDANDAELSEFSKELVKEVLAENKDAIITMAAEKLAESFKRTKAWKDATEEVLKNA